MVEQVLFLEILKSINLATRFLLELCILLSVGYWGFTTRSSLLQKFGLGLGAPLIIAIGWGVFLAPKSALRLPEPGLFIASSVIFGVAIAALYQAGRRYLAGAFLIVCVINTLLLYIWRQ
jgi:hypothetical protein